MKNILEMAILELSLEYQGNSWARFEVGVQSQNV